MKVSIDRWEATRPSRNIGVNYFALELKLGKALARRKSRTMRQRKKYQCDDEKQYLKRSALEEVTGNDLMACGTEQKNINWFFLFSYFFSIITFVESRLSTYLSKSTFVIHTLAILPSFTYQQPQMWIKQCFFTSPTDNGSDQNFSSSLEKHIITKFYFE